MSPGPGAIRAAILQPAVPDAADTRANLENALAGIATAGQSDVALLLMPEAFPGPMRAEAGADVEEELSAAAAEAEVALCWSRLERHGDRHHIVAYLTDRTGGRALRYVRAHPATGDVHPRLHGAEVSPGPELGLVDLDGIRIGITICSELWIPEAARVLCLRGADVLLGPAGGGFGAVAENWRLIVRARAIENNCHVLMTHSRYGTEPGCGLIAGPEDVVADGAGGAALVCGELDLARARWLRAEDDSMADPKPFRSLPGLLRAGRPELYSELGAPREDAYKYG